MREFSSGQILEVRTSFRHLVWKVPRKANDGRRGEGIYQKVMHAMKLLKDRGLPFGVSTCYTGMNVDSVSSEEYFDKLIDCGALFAWFFHYMPVRNDTSPELLLTGPAEEMYHAIRKFRSTKAIFASLRMMLNFVHGCIAGGRHYLHIDANGDVGLVCSSIYSNCNIKDTSLLDALKARFSGLLISSLSNKNMPSCPLLESQILPRVVAGCAENPHNLQSGECRASFAANVINMQPAERESRSAVG